VSVAGGEFNNLGGETTGTLNVNGVTLGQNGNQYRAAFTNSVSFANSNAALLTVNALPAVPSITALPATVEPNSGANQAMGPAGASSYLWTISNGTITSATNLQTVTHVAGPGGNVALGLTVTNAAGCSNLSSLNVPTNPQVRSIAIEAGAPTIRFTTIAGRNYKVERTDSLTPPLWVTVTNASNIPGTGGTVVVPDPDPGAASLSKRYYHVVLLP
jgi:hypothetical protein